MSTILIESPAALRRAPKGADWPAENCTDETLDAIARRLRARTALTQDMAFKAHCLNRHAFNLSILKYHDFQGYLVTGQNSGTHWVKWMLSHAMAHRYGVEPPRYFNNDSSNDLIGHPKHPRRHPQLPRIASSHSIPAYAVDWGWLRAIRRPPPYAVLVRDIRDVLISHYEKRRADYGAPFRRYLAGDPSGKAFKCDVWYYIRFLNRWGDIAGRYPDETLVLRYEDFRRDALGGLRRLALHFDLDLCEADLQAGVAVGSKAHMIACQDPQVDEHPVRMDGAGDTRFSADDLGLLGAILDRHLRHDFGYGYFREPRGFPIESAGHSGATPPLRWQAAAG